MEFWTWTVAEPTRSAAFARIAEAQGWDGLGVGDSQSLTGDPSLPHTHRPSTGTHSSCRIERNSPPPIRCSPPLVICRSCLNIKRHRRSHWRRNDRPMALCATDDRQTATRLLPFHEPRYHDCRWFPLPTRTSELPSPATELVQGVFSWLRDSFSNSVLTCHGTGQDHGAIGISPRILVSQPPQWLRAAT